MRCDRWIFVALLCSAMAFASGVSAQSVKVTGVVRDINTLEKIRGANIFVKGTNLGTSSDYSGRFLLKIPGATSQMVVVFRHVGYERLEVPLDSLKTIEDVHLQPRIIQLPGVEIQEEYQKLEIDKDLPQTVSVIESRNFEIQGYVDAGDLLRVDHSVQIDEELSGKKTAAIRGGNPDEVVVLYNGVKLNNTYDNVFDLSLIDLEDVDRLEIIKGSNTALYGPEAFSGVINIVPKIRQDYNIRFQQRLGTYRSGNWGLHLYKKFGRLHGSYSLKRGGTEREISDLDEGNLENTTLHHTANFSYSLSENPDGSPENSIGVMWLYTSLDYENRQQDGNDSVNEFQNNFNHLVSVRYSGNLPKFRNFDLSVSWRQLEDDEFSSFTSGRLTGSQDSGIEDKSFHINAEKRYEFGKADLLFGYQLQKADLLNELEISSNFARQPDIPPRLDLERTHHGFVAIGKLQGDTGSDFLQNFNVDLSLRHDRVNDIEAETSDSRSVVDNDWQETMVKFSVNAAGYRDDLSTNTFLNFGTNVKFPTLFQQVNTAEDVTLEPEKNSSFEGGVVISRETKDHGSIYGWQVSGNYFLNNYDDKLVEVRTLLGGRSLFFSTATARISGFEAKSSIFLFRKKLTVDFGWSRYFISEKEAFPFKSDFKRTLTFSVDHAGYSFQIHGFKEGEQVGLLRTTSGEVVQVPLPDYTNIDVHLSKTFEIGDFKVFANASARNLLEDDDTELLGLNIRDRRFYFTFGAQY